MKRILHAILYALLAGCARLPMAVIYGLSDITFVLLYYVVRYRRKVVDDNLKSSFPEKTDKERRQIRRKFYRNFTDYIFETIKLLHISDKEMERRFTFGNTAVIDDFVSAGRSVAVYFSHCGNWEWSPSVTLHTKAKPDRDAIFAQVYRPLRDKWTDALMLKLRSRFHSHSFPKTTVFRDIIRACRAEGMPAVVGFMSDQHPSHGDLIHVVEFHNRHRDSCTQTRHGRHLLGNEQTLQRALSYRLPSDHRRHQKYRRFLGDRQICRVARSKHKTRSLNMALDTQKMEKSCHICRQ